MREFPELPDYEKPRNLRPSNCQGCGALIGGVGGAYCGAARNGWLDELYNDAA